MFNTLLNRREKMIWFSFLWIIIFSSAYAVLDLYKKAGEKNTTITLEELKMGDEINYKGNQYLIGDLSEYQYLGEVDIRLRKK